MGHPASVLCIRLQELTVTEIEFPELMSGGLWQALLSAQGFAIAEAESESRLRQLLLDLLSTYSEQEESGNLAACLISRIMLDLS